MLKCEEQHVGGMAFHSPLDVVLPSGAVVQPDWFFVFDFLNRAQLYKRIELVPEWVLEILSPFKVNHDLVTKHHLYEQAGVRENWIVDPMSSQVEAFELRNEKYYTLHPMTDVGILHSTVLPGFLQDVKALFAAIAPPAQAGTEAGC
jgi:Uma2 family endonuclease